MTRQTSLEEAKQWLRERVRGGAECPCCQRYAKIYRRKLNSGMAAFMISTYKQTMDGNYSHIADLFNFGKTTSGTDFYLLKFWDLIEEKLNDDTEKKASGYWRTTQRGIEFALGELEVMSHVKMYGGKGLTFDGKLTDIETCLGKKFSYPELMKE